MSHADRNKHMIDARNQWAATRDGQITYKTRDVDHAYAEGFAAGRLSRRDELTKKLSAEIKRLNVTTPETAQPEITGILNSLRFINE